LTEKNVKVYSTPTCPWCRKAKEYLAEKGVQFTDFNVAEDRAKLQEMVQLTGQRGVPVIVIDDEMIVGFDQARIDQALAH
jgi:glutaredoxin-like YruB-family protein